MGTIRTAIALYDGVTSPLQSMHKAMGVVLNTFESMQQASGRAVDTAAIREAREEWAKAGTAFDAIEENIRNANNEQQKFNNSIRGGNNSANGLLSTIKKIAVAAGGIVGINKVQNISDKLASTKARLNLLVDDGGSVDVLEQKIMASAQRSRSVYFDTASAVAKLGLNAGNAFNGDMNQVIAFMEQVNKQFVIGGATAQEQSNAMIQLTQAMAAGALRGEELNSILDGAPGIARAIEKYMGIAEGSIKTVAQEGKVTAEVVKNAMFAMADETNAKFDSMPKTWAQIWVDMKNQALSMFAPILTKINQIGNSTKFQKVTTGLINGLAAVANVASSALDILIAIASVFVDNWGIIQPLVLGIAAAMLLYNGYLIANNAITAISNAQKGLAAVQAYKAAVANTTLAATEKAEAMAKASATAAQYGFNAALLACPLTWILLIIIAVIAAIYMIVAAINKLTGSTISATGIICGVVAVAGAFVLNCAIGVLNAIIQAIWTIFVAPFLGIVEWILNVCNGGFNSFGDAVANLIGQIIGWFLNLGKVVTTIIDAVYAAGANSKLTVGGTVKLVIINSSFKKPSEALVDQVQTAVDPLQNAGEGVGIAPIGHVVRVEGVGEDTINLSFDLYYQREWSWDDVSAYVTEAINGYFLELAQSWADQNEALVVRISQVESRLLGITGILDIANTKINGEAANCTLTLDHIPVLGTIEPGTIVISG